MFRCVSEVIGGPIPPFPIFAIPDSQKTLKFLTPKRPATHLKCLLCFKCPWAAAIAYHQLSRIEEFCLDKENNEIHAANRT
uniref:SFRICE_005310 n=1 Tax=Spodoptera frugiperda TaxID=7108 RepID=A0A2H1WIE3_SPOFR